MSLHAAGANIGYDETIALETRDVTKVFPGTVALDKVNFRVRRGKVNALVGENGAGKSTLMNILAGSLQPTKGQLFLDGEEIVLRSPRDALKYGIEIIHQELNLFTNLSVAENIFAGRELRKFKTVVDFGAQERAAASLTTWLQQDIDPRALVEDLRVGQQQLVEIAKVLSRQARVLIMDEPTSALMPAEVETLFEIIRGLKDAGVSIVYISHKFDELLKIADWVSIMRDGRLIAESPANEIDINGIVEKMVGRHPDTFYQKDAHEQGRVLLQAEQLTLPHPIIADRNLLDGVDITLHAGEVLGLYGLMGSGRTELLESLMGVHRPTTGEVRLDGKPITVQRINGRIRAGIALVPEDRQRDGIVHTLSVSSNMTLSSLRAFANRLGVLSRFREDEEAQAMIRRLQVVVANAGQPITSLSGGNQQKVVLAKALLTSPRVLLMDEPTRGIDVGAKSEIYRIINDLAKQGLGILLVSSELSEVLAMSDRIIVMAKGHIAAEFSRAEATEEVLVAASAQGTSMPEREETTYRGSPA